MAEITTIDIKQAVLSENAGLAETLRERLAVAGTFMLDVMASPGAGKTTLLLATIERLRAQGLAAAVIEGDCESTVDSEKLDAAGVKAVQLRTGGACHLDAAMVEAGLAELDVPSYDLIAIENVGNLVCPAEFDPGAHKRAMLLSVPEGHDKTFKYPLMFTVADALVVSKIDYLDGSDFDLEALRTQARLLNPGIAIFEVSAKTGDGMDAWCAWVSAAITSSKRA